VFTKITKAESTELLSQKDNERISASLIKKGKLSALDLEDLDREELLKDNSPQ
jgi:hypothetical protein